VMEALDGHLAVQSRLGRGSRFVVELPVAARATGPAPPRRDGGSAATATAPGAGPPSARPTHPAEVWVPTATPALTLTLLRVMRPRWRRLDHRDPAAVRDFAEAVQRLATAHADSALETWATRLAQADAAALGPLLRGFRRFLPRPPPAADLAQLRGLVELGLVTRIDDWCAAQTGRGPRAAAFAELVFGLTQVFDQEALLLLVDAGMDPDDATG
jgi:hypothetical protein